MTTHLMYLIRNQEKIINIQAGIIDELFQLVCKKYDDLDSFEPLLSSIKYAADKTKNLKGE